MHSSPGGEDEPQEKPASRRRRRRRKKRVRRKWRSPKREDGGAKRAFKLPLTLKTAITAPLSMPTALSTDTGRLNLVTLLALVLLAAGSFPIRFSASNVRAGRPLPLASASTAGAHFYASLPKLGPVGGLRLPGEPTVAAFLGIQYAAPPIGPLRFMPPTGSSHYHQMQALTIAARRTTITTSTTTLAGEHRLLMPANQLAFVKNQIQFASSCVHLADWLEEDESANASVKRQVDNFADNNNSSSSSNQQQQQQNSHNRHHNQAEDCLNLNVFVPLDGDVSSTDSNHSYNYRPQAGGKPVSQAANNGKHQQQGATRNSPAGSGAAAEPIWPLGLHSNGAAASGADKLPVLVLFNGPKRANGSVADDNDRQTANSFAYLEVARRLRCLVITFNNRIGLLGFLPLADNQTPAGSGGGAGGSMRHNHAIWDQLALLHWLRRNVGAFLGDPQNITLLALDNQASKLVQLLTMSPLAKGLFKRAILVHDERRNPEGPQFASAGLFWVDLRRQLASGLSRAAQNLSQAAAASSPTIASAATPNYYQEDPRGHEQSDQRKLLEFLQAANLRQLAKLDQELRRSATSHKAQLLELANGPNLADTLLFPHLSPPTGSGGEVSWLTNLSSMARWELDYCLYVRQLYLGAPDPLGLVAGASGRSLQVAASRSAQTLARRRILGDQLGLWRREQLGSAQALRSRARRSLIGVQFKHLHNLRLLAQSLIAASSQSSDVIRTSPELQDEDDDNDDEDDKDDVNVDMDDHNVDEARIYNYNRSRKSDNSSNKSSADDINHGGDDSSSSQSSLRRVGNSKRSRAKRSPLSGSDQELPLASVQLMFGLFLAPGQSRGQELHASGSGAHDLSNIVATLSNNIQSSGGLGEHSVAWLKFVDLHFVASSAPDSGEQLCNLLGVVSSAKKSGSKAPKSFAFMRQPDAPINQLDNLTSDSQAGNWLLEALERPDDWPLIDGLSNFIKFGSPSSPTSSADQWKEEPRNGSDQITRASYWPPYDSLSRKFKRLPTKRPQRVQPTEWQQSDETKRSSSSSRVRLQLDLLPYLNEMGASMAQTASPSSEHMIELKVCLSELNSALAHDAATIRSGQQQQLRKLPADRLQCLTDLMARFGAHLRQYAAEDLEPLARLMSQQQQQQHQRHQQQPASIATRNFANDDALIAANEQNASQPEVAADEATTSTSTILGSLWSSSQLAPTSQQGAALNATSGQAAQTGGGIRGFLGRVYRDAVGKALGIVIGTGLTIFLLNLAIVLIISLRSARGARKRRGREMGEQAGAGNALEAPPNHLSMMKKPSLRQQGSLRGVNGSGGAFVKQLKFDLPVAPNDFGLGGEAMEPLEASRCLMNDNDPHHHQHQHQHHHHHHNHSHAQQQQPQQVLLLDDRQRDELLAGIEGGQANGGELLLSAAPLLPATLEPDGGEPEAGACALPTSGWLLERQHYTGSPFAELASSTCQSHSTSTATSTSQQRKQQLRLVHHQMRPARQQQQQTTMMATMTTGNALGSFQQLNSPPSSSTSLSMTPIQLQESSFAFNHSNQRHQIQLMEPIAMLYQTNNAQGSQLVPIELANPASLGEGAEKMYMLESPEIVQQAQNDTYHCLQRHYE